MWLDSHLPGVSAIPRADIAVLPTPLEHLDSDLPPGLPNLWLKHDGLSGLPYGGNKVRKLEFLLGQARAEERRAVITFGAVGSNHVLATATYGHRAGLEVHAVLTPQIQTPYLKRNLLADIAAGAVLHPVPRFEDALRRAVEVRSELTARDGVEPFVIPFGGTSPRGTLGFVNAAFELADQVSTGEMPEPDVVYVPFGSMGTAIGLALGLAAAAMKTKVVAVRVVPDDFANEVLLERVIGDAVGELRSADRSFPALKRPDLALDVRSEFLGDGYAHRTPAGLEAVSLAAEWGLTLETTYTGKALGALLSDAREGCLADSRVLFWNTYNSRPLNPPPVPAGSLPEELRSYLDEEPT